ncbi:MAG: hypothetical protein VB875_17850 [Pirellulales bacterium]
MRHNEQPSEPPWGGSFCFFLNPPRRQALTAAGVKKLKQALPKCVIRH